MSTWSALIAFTRIPSPPSSTAATRSAWSSAALLPPYATASLPGTSAAFDTEATMEPPSPWRRITAAARPIAATAPR